MVLSAQGMDIVLRGTAIANAETQTAALITVIQRASSRPCHRHRIQVSVPSVVAFYVQPSSSLALLAGVLVQERQTASHAAAMEFVAKGKPPTERASVTLGMQVQIVVCLAPSVFSTVFLVQALIVVYANVPQHRRQRVCLCVLAVMGLLEAVANGRAPSLTA